MSEAADYSFSRPSPAPWSPLGTKTSSATCPHRLTGKNITGPELKALRDAGLGICLVWESVDQRAATSGAEGGAEDGAMANGDGRRPGVPGKLRAVLRAGGP